MFFNTIKAICISLLLIALIHYLYAFFKDTLTVPKIKDLVNKPADTYKEIYETIEKYKTNEREKIKDNHPVKLAVDNESMKDELKNFLNNLSSNNLSSNNLDSTNTFNEKQEINSFEYGSSSFSTF